MNHSLQNMNEILDSRITGYHQYCLCPPARPVYISRNLCRMLELSRDALLSETADRYAQQVHPADRQRYAAFLDRLAETEQTLTLEYWLVKSDGSVLFVRDTMTSYRGDGGMLADSVLTDITALKNENQNLQLIKNYI